MPGPAQLEIILILVLLSLLLLLVGLAARQRLASRAPGRCRCAARIRGRWRAGVLRYRSDRLVWVPRSVLGLGTSRVVTRKDLREVRRTTVRPADLPASLRTADPVRGILTRADGSEIELALARSAYNGLASWSEAAPPAPHARFL